MHPMLLKEVVALCKRRQSQGDHPIERPASLEALENAVVQLSAASEPLNESWRSLRQRQLPSASVNPHGAPETNKPNVAVEVARPLTDEQIDHAFLDTKRTPDDTGQTFWRKFARTVLARAGAPVGQEMVYSSQESSGGALQRPVDGGAE